MEVHKDDWWIQKYAMYGFIYDEKLTKEIRGVARAENKAATIFPPKNKTYNAQHVWTSMKVFLNPAVGGLPQHGHLFGELGCYDGRKKSTRACSGEHKETPLDPAYLPLPLTNEQDQAWYDIVKANIKK